MQVDQVVAITGLSPEEAGSFLEMAGGNVEMAVALFFDMGSGAGSAGLPPVSPTASPTADSPAHALLFGSAIAPRAWIEQGFEFSTDAHSRCGIIQHENGPCGVLACVNAQVLADLGCPLPSLAVDDATLCTALGAILWRCAGTSGRVTLCRWADGVGGPLAPDEPFAADGVASVAAQLQPFVPSLKQRGGCCLFCYACVLTRGVNEVRADVALDGGSTPLVSGPHALCGTELVNLLVAGVARANVGAYEGGGAGGKVRWRAPSPIGLLSRDELETGVPLADVLKSPSQPIWILHGGDHFTVGWVPATAPRRFEARVRALHAALVATGTGANEAAAAALEAAQAEFRQAAAAQPPPPPPPPDGAFDMAFWNGLPPARALCWLRLRGCGEPTAPAPPAPDAHSPSHWRLTEGEVESIVQAAPEDKKARPGCWREHRYELNLVTRALAEEDAASAVRPPTAPPAVTLDPGTPPPLGAGWRCAACYNSRFQTMCFGENATPGEAAACKFCGKTALEAGWTIWRAYDALPPPVQRRVDRTSGPKVLTVLRTRWSEASIAVVAADGGEMRPGYAGYDAAMPLPAV